MVFHLDLPKRLAGFRIDRMDECANIAKIGDVAPAGLRRCQTDCRADATLGFVRPVNAAAGSVERVHRASGATNEQPACGYGGLRESRPVTRKAERPFEF